MQQADDLRAEGAALYELIQGIGDDEWSVVTPFKNYTVYCNLQAPTSPSNHYTCPLPPVSPLACTTCAV